MRSSLSPFLEETIRLTYWFWFKPITLHRYMRQLAGDIDLRSSLLRKRVWQPLSRNRAFLRMLLQIGMSAFVALAICYVLGEGIASLGVHRAFRFESVAGGVALGVALGVAGGAAFGVVFGVASFGVALGGAGGVAFCVALGASDGVAVGAAVGAAVGVALGAAVGVAFGVAVGVSSSVRLGVAFGVTFGVAEGVAVGAAFVMAYGVATFRLYAFPFWSFWAGYQALRSHGDSGYARNAFSRCPIELDELIYPPLPFFDRFIVYCARADPEKRSLILGKVLASTGQRWAARRAAYRLLVDDLQGVPDIWQLKDQADALGALLDSKDGARLLTTAQIELFDNLRRIADILGSLANIASLDVARRTLTDARTDLDNTATAATYAGLPPIENIARHWQSLITRHEEIQNAIPALRSKLQSVYVASGALEAGSPVFRGREDIFALVEEAVANPNRTETLMLVGQPRMGKSTVLRQLPLRLPGQIPVYVDCQGRFAADTTAGYVSAFTAAVTHSERLRRGGLRLQPIEIEDLQRDPFVKLNRWLDAVAAQAQAKGHRLVLCLDEFETIIFKIQQGVVAIEALDQLRGLSAATGWLVLFSGQYQLDDLASDYAAHFKNVRRLTVRYLDEPSARDLIERPESDFGMKYVGGAVDAIIARTRCQPLLIQAMCSCLVSALNADGRRTVRMRDVAAAEPVLMAQYPYYFESVASSLKMDEYAALRSIAHRRPAAASTQTLGRLVDQDYLEVDGAGIYRFQVPLLEKWFAMR